MSIPSRCLGSLGPRLRSVILAFAPFLAPLVGPNRADAQQRSPSSSAQPAISRVGHVIADDIARFWQAYDTVRALSDTLEQIRAVQRLYIDPGSPGLQGLIAVRRYSASEFARAISAYPRYWQSIRTNTLRVAELSARITNGITAFQVLYPEGRPADVYFAIGVFRTPGTIHEGRVLIGAELALADPQTVTTELPPRLTNLTSYVARDPIAQVVPLNVHEYVHTQQRDKEYRVLDMVLFEGIAEYLSVLATGVPSAYAPLAYERAHRDTVRAVFARELVSERAVDRWLYNDATNRFGMRDVGYAVGYEIARRFVARSTVRRAAIRALVELDYAKPIDVARIVDASGYLTRPLAVLLEDLEARRPTVTHVMSAQADSLSAITRRLTLHFSVPMDTSTRGFDVGGRGEMYSMRVERLLGWSADRRSMEIEVRLPALRPAQLVISPRFENAEGGRLRQYLVEFPVPSK